MQTMFIWKSVKCLRIYTVLVDFLDRTEIILVKAEVVVLSHDATGAQQGKQPSHNPAMKHSVVILACIIGLGTITVHKSYLCQYEQRSEVKVLIQVGGLPIITTWVWSLMRWNERKCSNKMLSSLSLNEMRSWVGEVELSPFSTSSSHKMVFMVFCFSTSWLTIVDAEPTLWRLPCFTDTVVSDGSVFTGGKKKELIWTLSG